MSEHTRYEIYRNFDPKWQEVAQRLIQYRGVTTEKSEDLQAEMKYHELKKKSLEAFLQLLHNKSNKNLTTYEYVRNQLKELQSEIEAHKIHLKEVARALNAPPKTSRLQKAKTAAVDAAKTAKKRASDVSNNARTVLADAATGLGSGVLALATM